jgi:hypothetical protein
MAIEHRQHGAVAYVTSETRTPLVPPRALFLASLKQRNDGTPGII